MTRSIHEDFVKPPPHPNNTVFMKPHVEDFVGTVVRWHFYYIFLMRPREDFLICTYQSERGRY